VVPPGRHGGRDGHGEGARQRERRAAPARVPAAGHARILAARRWNPDESCRDEASSHRSRASVRLEAEEARMDLTGLPFLLLVVTAAVAAAAGTVLLWNRWRRWRAYATRALCLLLVMGAGAALAATAVNREYGFYTSFADLLGGPVAGGPDPARVAPAARGRIVAVTLAGARSGLRRGAYVYLPAAYFQPSQADRRFPVLELFHGFPGSPGNWTNQLHLGQVLDAEIAAGRAPPLIAVVPELDDHGSDSECVDAVGGQRNETYLAVDVPSDIRRQFRALATPRSWATLGYSMGGFCAVNLALHHPDLYGAAASLSGYYSALVDGSTGDLYKGDAAAQRWNSPVWVVAHRPVSTPLYLVASRGDLEAIHDLSAMRRAARKRVPVTGITLASGGHNFHVWSAACFGAVQWLGSHLPGPPAHAVVVLDRLTPSSRTSRGRGRAPGARRPRR
jgi:S-formylglutathione hydrolase FrmB